MILRFKLVKRNIHLFPTYHFMIYIIMSMTSLTWDNNLGIFKVYLATYICSGATVLNTNLYVNTSTMKIKTK